MKNGRNLILWVLVFSGILFFVQSLRTARSPEQEIPYSQFKRLLSEGLVTEVRVREDLIRGRWRDGQTESLFRAVPMNDPNLVADLEKSQVRHFSGETERGWVNALLMNAA